MGLTVATENVEGNGHLVRSCENTEDPILNYQNRSKLILLVTEIMSWLKLEINNSVVKTSVFFISN
jgi:hypothetical protein